VRAAVMTAFREPFRIEERPDPVPGPGQVLLRVRASGLCGTDLHIWRGEYPGLAPPLVLGHEPAGVVEAPGAGVTHLRQGDRVGVPWVQRGCRRCDACGAGREMYCRQAVTWATLGGGNAELMLADAAGCVLLPEDLAWEQAAPMFCSGFTVMSGYRNAAPRPGDRIAVLGAGGLGHLAIQVARALGHEVVAVTNAGDKLDMLRALGADHVLVVRHHAGRELRALGGVDVVLSTSNSMTQTAELLLGLRDEGRLVVMGMGRDPIPVPPNLTVSRQLVVKGSKQNDRRDLAEILALAGAGRVRALVETWALEDVNRAWERLEQGRLRFRAVLLPAGPA
jgi:D-arabinose 1-dehydrogenase-like Zn-dependent alcohol dehydrogenase